MKLKIKNLNKLIKQLSGREIDFFLYLIKRQNDFGQVREVYYKDVMTDLLMPKSTFYGVLSVLEEKKFVYIDWNDNCKKFYIIVNDNIFTTKDDYNEGYLKINLDFILSPTFIKLHVNLKKFFLRILGMQAETRKVRITDEMLKEYKVYKYFDELKQIFKITYLKDAYLFTLKDELKNKTHQNMNFLQYQHKLIAYCSKFKIAYTTQELIDSVNVIMNYKDKKANRINKALDYIRDKHLLQPALINYMCNC